MLEVRFVLFGRKADGSVIELFRWTRDAESGVRRAWADAERFGMEFSSVWAEPV